MARDWGPYKEVRLPFEDIGDLLLSELPPDRSLSIPGIPGSSGVLSVRGVYGRLHVAVMVSVDRDLYDPSAVRRYNRKWRRMRNFFCDQAAAAELKENDGPTSAYVISGRIEGSISWFRPYPDGCDAFLIEVLQPFVDRLRELEAVPDTQIFICHASEDRAFVERLCSALDTHEKAVWYDQREIRVGDSIVQQVNSGLAEASHVAVVLSKSSVRKPWVLQELSSTLIRKLQNDEVQLLPLLIDTCELPPLLADLKYADFRKSEDLGLEELLRLL